MSARNTLAGKARRRAARSVRRLRGSGLTVPFVRHTICRYCSRRRQVFVSSQACLGCTARIVAAITPPWT